MTDIVSSLRIEALSRAHNRDHFDCGKAPLNDYLRKYAGQNDRNHIARSFVALDETNNVVGYYSLCTASILFEELPEDVRKRLPEYPVPAALIAKLAIDNSMREQGLGARLLISALERILAAANELAVKVVLVDAKDEEARNFYKHFGFIELPEQAFKLYLPIESVSQIFTIR